MCSASGGAEARSEAILLFVWVLWLIHLTIHNNTPFHASIILLLFFVSVVTSLSLFSTYFIIYFVKGDNAYDTLYKESLFFIPQEIFNFTITLSGIALFIPLLCSVLMDKLEGASKYVKSLFSYMFMFHIMVPWFSSYAFTRCWDVGWDNNYNVILSKANDMEDDDVAEDKEEQIDLNKAKFLQKSRVITLGLVGINVGIYVLPIICFVLILLFLLSFAGFAAMSFIILLFYNVGFDISCLFSAMTRAKTKASNTLSQSQINLNSNKMNNNDAVEIIEDQRKEHSGAKNSSGNNNNNNNGDDDDDDDDDMIYIPSSFVDPESGSKPTLGQKDSKRQHSVV